VPALFTYPFPAARPGPGGPRWEPYLAPGTLAVLDGDPGVGKTFLALDLAARLSRGGPLPDGQRLDRPYSTLFISAEDCAADTLRPRAEAAGADLERLFLIAPDLGPLPEFPDDLPALEETVRHHRISFIVLDPLAAFTPARSGNGDRAVRETLKRLADLAVRLDCLVLLHRHLTKYGGLRWLYRGLGRVGTAPAVRTGLLLARHPADPALRVLTRTVPAAGPPAPSLTFWLAAGYEDQPTLRWQGPSDLTAGDLLGTRRTGELWPRERAIEWLRYELRNGVRRAAELFAAASAAGITRRTLERAKRDLGVESRQVWRGGTNEWVWSAPGTPRPRATIWHPDKGQGATLRPRPGDTLAL
jgi:hypothetical protein